MLPRHMGVVRRDFPSNRTLCCLLPFNWLWRWWTISVWWLQIPTENTRRDVELKAAYERGRIDGVRIGASQIIQTMEEMADRL